MKRKCVERNNKETEKKEVEKYKESDYMILHNLHDEMYFSLPASSYQVFQTISFCVVDSN